MGFSNAWIAVKTSESERLFEAVRASPTDEPDDDYATGLCGAPLEGGWFLFIGRGCDHRLIDPDFLASVSSLGRTVACSVEEHVMFSSAALWEAGAESWSIVHDAQQGMFDLTESGDVPPSFEPIRASALEEQEREGGEDSEVDFIFDVPLLVAKELTGFKLDETPDCLAAPHILAFTDEAPRRPWWKFW